jgi:putative transposase
VARPAAEQPEASRGKENEQSASRRRWRGPSAAEQAEVERLRRQNEKLAKDLARTQAALEIMGEAHALWSCSPRARTDARTGAGQVMDEAFAGLVGAGVDVRRARKLVGRPRSTHYWRARPRTAVPAQRRPRPVPANALTGPERDRVLALLRDPSFVDKSPAQVWARPLDDGTYLCSQSTMYRILRASGESKERRRQATHPAKVKPELMAHRPGEIYSWDITKLRGPWRGIWYNLYVMIDISSRYVVGWRVEQTETAELATEFIDDVIRTDGKPRAVHADRGTSMTSKSVAALLVDLDVARSHSRPHVSNDNPYSEAAFKTLKYCPAFPDHFDDIDHARAFCKEFFDDYNHAHYHSGLGLHTPASVHFGTAEPIRADRADVLAAAYARNPERFSRRPEPPKLPTIAWINPPDHRTTDNSVSKKLDRFRPCG